MGVQVETGTVTGIEEAMDPLPPSFSRPEAYGTWRDVIEAATAQRMYARILDRFRGGADHSAPDYVAAWRRLRDLRAVWAAETPAAYDAVILPTVPNAPPPRSRGS